MSKIDISFVVTACNEDLELYHILTQLNTIYNPEINEVWVQLDSNYTPEVDSVVKRFSNFKSNIHPLQGDFSQFRNNILDKLNGKWVFMIDADELLSDELLNGIHSILELNEDVDVIGIPRVNLVEKIGLSHVLNWGWNITSNDRFTWGTKYDLNNPVDKDSYELLKSHNLIHFEGEDGIVRFKFPIINYPDMQFRIFKNDPKIRWTGKVHEHLTGFNKISTFPLWDESPYDLSLLHVKTIERQEKQNEMYSKIIQSNTSNR